MSEKNITKNKIVFFDIDGTLLDKNKNLPPLTKKAIHQLKREGVIVAIATGRAPFMYENLRKELSIDSHVSCNGQYVVLENEIIYTNPMKKDGLEDLYELSKKKGHPLVFLDENTMKSSVDFHQYIQDSIGSLKFPHPEKDEFFFKKRDIYQTLVFCNERDEGDYREKFQQFRFVRWHPVSLDVLPVNGSKAEGIKKIIELLQIPLSNVYAFGDGLNDMEMLQTVGTGVAMGNAQKQVKEVASIVTKDVSENGIWYGLKELDLI